MNWNYYSLLPSGRKEAGVEVVWLWDLITDPMYALWNNRAAFLHQKPAI